MNLQSIIITDSMGVLILIVLLLSSYLVRQRRQISDRFFTIMCVVTVFSCVCDMISFIVDGQDYDGARATAYFTNYVTYTANIVVSCMWMLYVDLRLYGSSKHMRRTLKRMCLPGALGLVGLVLNMKWHFVFSIDSDNVYHRKAFATYYFSLTFFYLFASVFVRRRHRRRYGKTRFVPVWLFLMPVIVCATAQYFIYGVSLAWCSVAIGLVSMHMGLQNELSYLDPLTKIYNRNYLSHLLSMFRYSHTEVRGIMLDMDRFKAINDNYGHDEGDAALIAAARILSISSTEKAIPIRYAGDEFMVIIPSGTDNDIEEIKANIRKEEKAFNASGKKPYKLLFSLGTGKLSPGGDLDKFLKEMDDNMYEEKKSRHDAEECVNV